MLPLPEVTGYSDPIEIGRGGFARVYRAHQDRFNRSVALKVLNLADPDERTRDRFERECRAMGELSWHPHVVGVYDSGITDDGHLWLAMEHLERGSLADAGILDWQATLVAGIEVCGALGAAHAAGTLHRDLKPENVLVGPFGEAKLADFGIAAVDGGRRTTTGVASFTVAHVSPEVLRGQRQDERTDVYGMASTMHTLLTGEPPFTGDPDEPVAAVMMRIIEAPPPRLGEPVPAEVADLLVAGLSKDPDDRPQSAAALGEALQDIQRRYGQPVTPLRLTASAARAAGSPPVAVVSPAAAAPVPPAVDEAPASSPDAPPAPVAPDPSATIAGTVLPGPAVSDTADIADAAVPVEPDPNATVTLATPAAGAAPADPQTDLGAGSPPPQAGPPPGPTADPPTAPPADPPARGRGRLVLAATAVVLVLLVGAVVLLTGGDDDDGGSGDAVAGTFQTAAFATNPAAVAVNAEAVWVTDANDTLIHMLDPVTGEPITDTGMNNTGTAIALTDDDSGWVIGNDTREVIRIDLPTNADTDQVDVGEDMTSVSAVGTDVWITTGPDGQAGQLVRVDATAFAASATIEVGSVPNQVAATDDVVWVTSSSDVTLTRVDPDIDEINNVIGLEVVPSAVAAVEDAVWVLSAEARSLTRIDPATNEVVTVIDLDQDGGATPNAVAATATGVWVTDGELDRVYFIDPGSNEVVDEIPVGQEPVAVAATDADVWVANSGDGTVTHIDPSAFG